MLLQQQPPGVPGRASRVLHFRGAVPLILGTLSKPGTPASAAASPLQNGGEERSRGSALDEVRATSGTGRRLHADGAEVQGTELVVGTRAKRMQDKIDALWRQE